MDVIREILSEDEVRCMPDETLVAFSKILNVEMKKDIADYVNSPEADPEAKKKLETLLGDDVDQSVFHITVRDKNIMGYLRQANLKSLPSMAASGELDLDAYISALTWLMENEENIKTEVGTRDKDDFEDAVEKLTEFQLMPGCNHEHNLPRIVVSYKNTLFCPTHEKSQGTGLRQLANSKNYWKMQLKAAKYLKYCKENNISWNVAREV